MKQLFSAIALCLFSFTIGAQEIVTACFEGPGTGNAMHFYSDPDLESEAMVVPRKTMQLELEDYFLLFLESFAENGIKDDTTFFQTVRGGFGYKEIKTKIKACFTGEVLETKGDSILVKKLAKDSMRLSVNAEIFELQDLAKRIYADNEFLFEENKRKVKEMGMLLDELACNTVFFYNGKDVWSSKSISPCENEFICSCKDGIEDEQWFPKEKWTVKAEAAAK